MDAVLLPLTHELKSNTLLIEALLLFGGRKLSKDHRGNIGSTGYGHERDLGSCYKDLIISSYPVGVNWDELF